MLDKAPQKTQQKICNPHMYVILINVKYNFYVSGN